MQLSTKYSLKLSMYFIGLFLFSIPLWVDRFFGSATLEQLLFTLQFGASGVISSDPIFIKRFIKWCVIAPILLSVFFLYIEKYIKRYCKGCLHLAIFISGSIYFLYQFNLLDFVRINYTSRNAADYYSKNYINPTNIVFHATHPKNLVLIYVEGFESNYANEKIFKKNLLRRLNDFDNDSVSFDKFKQVYGTGWTVAGLVATQCGIPLKSNTVFGNNRQGELTSQFLPNATCLSDILAKNGYRNIYMKGASLRFGGVKQFLKTHHYEEMYGKEEWLATTGINDMAGWGLHDDVLFAQAKTRLNTLMQSKERFNLTLLTVDTHGDKGYLNQTCRQQGYRQFDGIVECTANELNDFITYIKKNGWLDKISVVIIGDHLAMRNPVYEKLLSHSPRYVFNLMLTSPRLSKRTNDITHFDMLPTILDTLNFNYAGGRLALGYSGLERADGLPVPQDRIARVEAGIENHSEIYNKLWLPQKKTATNR